LGDVKKIQSVNNTVDTVLGTGLITPEKWSS